MMLLKANAEVQQAGRTVAAEGRVSAPARGDPSLSNVQRVRWMHNNHYHDKFIIINLYFDKMEREKKRKERNSRRSSIHLISNRRCIYI